MKIRDTSMKVRLQSNLQSTILIVSLAKCVSIIDAISKLFVCPSLQIIQSPELNLQLGPVELAALQEMVTADRSGLIPYAEFAAQAGDIISSLYHDKPSSEVYTIHSYTD